jgi:hypothetical protein
MKHGVAWRGAVFACAMLAAAVADAGAGSPKKRPAAPDPTPPPGPQAPVAAAPLHFLPKARRLTTYTEDVRFEITTKDISFEAPDAYKDGFDFWASRMRGQRKSEVFQIVTITEDAGEGGLVPFRRTFPKFDLEVQKQGQILESPPTMQRALATRVFEGTLDPFGNVKVIKKVAGKDDPEIDALSIPEVSRLFPEVDGPRDLKIGEGFKEEKIIRLPTKLNIAGLETVTLKETREYSLKSVSGDLATFEVKTTYADDPVFKPAIENTACRISGGGSGETVFEIRRGVFQAARVPTTLHIDIEAPLRPLPDHPETDQPLLGKSHIELTVLLAGEQSARRIWGEEQD